MLLQAPSLAALPRIRHGFFTREGGVSQGLYASLNAGLGSHDAPENVGENRARMAAALGVAREHLVTAYQAHSPDVVVAETPWTRADAPRADAVVTCVPGLAVGVTTADCGPLLFADAEAGIVAATHAGWKGALTGVVEATLAAMVRLGAARSRITAALGPMIRKPSYEVGPELVARFTQAAGDDARFFQPSPRPGHSLFDLAGLIVARLGRAGIARCEDLGQCTYADQSRFFSYRRATHRREPDYGRHISAIAIAE
jgi:polyphenol oxidase